MAKDPYSTAPYDIDLVFCIDATSSMKPFLKAIKELAKNFPNDIIQEARKSGRSINNFRVRLIAFRDYLADDKYAMQTTAFFDLPQEAEDLDACFSEIEVFGGGDEPEDALEALAYAMNSDWQPKRQGIRRRQIIVLWTDASAHDLGNGMQSPYYDPDLPKDFEELISWWGDNEEAERKMDYHCKRLVLFAPAVKPWTVLSSSWDNVIHYPSASGEGLRESDYRQIIRLIVWTL